MLHCKRARLRRKIAQPLGRGEVAHMDDQRVEARPAFGGEDARDGFGVGGVGRKPVDRLGWIRENLSRMQLCKRP